MTTAFSCPVFFPFTYSYNENRYHGRIKIKINATSSTKVKTLNEIVGAGKGSSSLATSTEICHLSQEQIRQKIPTKKQLVDPYRQGLIIERGVGYRQTVVVRSYEVGLYKTATLESLLNLFQVIKLSLFQCNSWEQFIRHIYADKFVMLRTTHDYVGNGIKSCMDVRTSKQWIWSHTWNGEEQSHMGRLKNARPSGSLSHMVSLDLFIKYKAY